MEATGGPTPGNGRRVAVLSPEMVEQRRDSVSRAVVELPVNESTLEYSISQFPEGFPLGDWKAAAVSEDPAEANKTSPILWEFIMIVNRLNTIVMNGTVVTGLMHPSQLQRAVPTHYEALGEAGVLGEGEVRDLKRVNEIGHAATHWYAKATPAEFHEGIELLRKTVLAPPMRGRLETWIAEQVLSGGEN